MGEVLLATLEGAIRHADVTRLVADAVPELVAGRAPHLPNPRLEAFPRALWKGKFFDRHLMDGKNVNREDGRRGEAWFLFNDYLLEDVILECDGMTVGPIREGSPAAPNVLHCPKPFLAKDAGRDTLDARPDRDFRERLLFERDAVILREGHGRTLTE
tara:strand:+ start:36542 stop:37015 length:474 start_codon:yes stop_codon:yes gene_type:complete